MQYHIQTRPIWDAFRAGDGCPVCRLYEETESRIVKQYLNEAVMEPDYRIRGNKLGFCERHLKQLYSGGNKLGVSLQIHTRTEHVLSEIKPVKNAKQAKHLAEKLEKSLATCVICDEVDEIMTRYCYTAAQMFARERDFPAALASCGGFCLHHFAELLKYAGYAGRCAETYAAALHKTQVDAMRKACSDLDRFAGRFDYRSADKFSGSTDDALSAAINLLGGHIVD